MKLILHIDNDSYFVSALRTIDDSLVGKPVVIGKDINRGIATAASYEARERGIKVPMPIYKAKKIVPNIIVASPNFKLFTDLANQVNNFLIEKYTNKLEISSIDESYMDATDIWKKWGSPVKLAKDIQNSILKKFSLPVSIGIGTNKFVAKMSTQVNKPFGITITKPDSFLERFGNYDIQKFHGIGKGLAPKFRNIGISTIKDLASSSIERIEHILGVLSQEYLDKANGISKDYVNNKMNDLKGIGNMFTFTDYDRTNLEDIFDVFKDITSLVIKRVKMRNLKAKVIVAGYLPPYQNGKKWISKQITLDRPTSNLENIFKNVRNIFKDIWKGEPVKGLHVRVTSFIDIFEDSYQTSIFDKEIKNNKIEKIINKVNKNMRLKAIFSGKELEENIKKKTKQSRFLLDEKYTK